MGLAFDRMNPKIDHIAIHYPMDINIQPSANSMKNIKFMEEKQQRKMLEILENFEILKRF